MPLDIANGTQVRAKRLGWDEELSPVQLLDRDPYEHEGDDDLEGSLDYQERQAPWGRIVVCLVGGQEADPKTVVAVEVPA